MRCLDVGANVSRFHTSMTQTEQPVRVGIIGAGGIVKQRHMPGLRAIPNVQIVQVTNRSLASSEAFCREFAPEAQAVERWEEVASSRDVDVVWIGTHPYMHAEMTCYALQHGKHVFTQARMAALASQSSGIGKKAPPPIRGRRPTPAPTRSSPVRDRRRQLRARRASR